MFRCWAPLAASSLSLCCFAAAQSPLPGDRAGATLNLPSFAILPSKQVSSPSASGAQPLSSIPMGVSATLHDEEADDSDITRYKASTYVPIDSWVYPALERLIALGYIWHGSLAIRPITRLECQRLLAEARARNDEAEIDSPQNDPNIEPLLTALDREFAHERHVADGDQNTNSTIDSVYARFDEITGSPLRDSFHFGQTVYNDFGRP